jgi:hypothetical protein
VLRLGFANNIHHSPTQWLEALWTFICQFCDHDGKVDK